MSKVERASALGGIHLRERRPKSAALGSMPGAPTVIDVQSPPGDRQETGDLSMTDQRRSHRGLSVVIPARNEEKLLGACLTALRNQWDLVDEIIVVDNGSTDDTAELARSYPGVIVVAEPRQGITYARNTGFDVATADIVARIDADTMVSPGWARAIRSAFARMPDLAGLAGPAGFTRLSSGDRVVGRTAYGLFRALNELIIGDGPLMYGHNMAISRSAWTRIRDLVTTGDGTISEDVDVALALLHTGQKVAYVPEMLVTIAVERTLRRRKLVSYHRTNHLTKAKYRELRVDQSAIAEQP